MIDLHTHTNESDGTAPPEELIREAQRAGVEVLSITDHDTFAGYDQAVPVARQCAVPLLCGIELSVKSQGYTVHLLGYFPQGVAKPFRDWIAELQASRRDRNVRLVRKLQSLGLDITLQEAEARGKGMTGRPHFAAILVEKGYVANYQQAFDQYLDESAAGYVTRQEPSCVEAISRIHDAGGISSLAHPCRLKVQVGPELKRLRAQGLDAVEAYHSDHEPHETALYLDLAERLGLMVTGGSDFHGAVKPEIKLGTGKNNLCIPKAVFERMASFSR